MDWLYENVKRRDSDKKTKRNRHLDDDYSISASMEVNV
jgi:hypothetical protein